MKTAIYWFRNDLRVVDNHLLKQATEENDQIIGVYILEDRLLSLDRYGFAKTGPFRLQFLLQSLQELKSALLDLNIPLIVLRGSGVSEMKSLISNNEVTSIYNQLEWTSEEVDTETKLRNSISASVRWIQSYDQFLLHPSDLPFSPDRTPRGFTSFRKKIENRVDVRPVEVPSPMKSTPEIEADGIPVLEELIQDKITTDDRSAFPFRGGQTQALDRLRSYIWETKKVRYYKKTRNGLVGTDYSSKFSPWLANGSLSARSIYWEVRKFEKIHGSNESTYWLIFELIWRDFFKYVSLKHQNKIFKTGGILEREYSWSRDRDKIEQWIKGETPEPFVNANMIELARTGWMSNRGRQNVASYFSKDMGLDWRIGAAYFESMLIDYDVHSNYGNWMYVAGVGNDPRDRKFNVASQAERYDPNGRFQRIWLQTTLF
ncbi:DASH family cryptochrome [Aureitalea marina]|nr:DASH family cryptochrome [Aureitalea marina]